MSKPLSYQLFVYGSLCKGFHHPAYQYISHYFNFVAAARVKGLLYDMGDYPAAVPTDTDHFVTGELYELKHEDEYGWAMAQLDDYEGTCVELNEIALYRRDIATVFVDNGNVQAWIYWYNRAVDNHPVITSGDALQYSQGKNNQ